MPNDLLDKILTFGRKPSNPIPTSFSLDTNLTPHFTLRELCRTSHRELDNIPPLELVPVLTSLAERFLEPIRNQFGPIIINSGYRSKAVNKAIKGSKDSAHLYGVAADIVPFASKVTLQEIVDWVIASSLQFDQLILESSSTSNWIHIGGLRPNHEKWPRREALRFLNGKYSKYNKDIKYGV